MPTAAASARPLRRGFQWDLARQVERPDFLLRWLPHYAEWGYEELYLHLEDAVEFPSLPGVARRDAFTRRQFEHLAAAAARAGLRVVPIVNLLGHTQYLVKTPALRDLNELRDAAGRPLAHGQICPLHPRTLEVAEKLLRDVVPFCTAGLVHAGLDESYHLGRCPRCRADIARHGLAGHFAGHVRRLHALARGLGLRLGLWADMFYYLPGAIAQLPPDVTAYEWYYYPFARRPRVELYNFAEADLATPLRRRGIARYGCPMDGAFRWEPLPSATERLANIRSWWRHCQATGADGFLVTSWEPSRLAPELTLALDAAAAGLWLEPEAGDPHELLARGCERVFGAAGRAAARAWLAADRFPFSGYPRWQINSRWDTVLSRAPLQPWSAESRALDRLARTRRLPAALRASLQFRAVLAQRDLFVRRAGQAVLALRRRRPGAAGWNQLSAEARQFAQTLRTGRAAARAMWRRSRDARVRGPNELMLRADAGRLRAWQAWLRAARRNPARVFRASPFCGVWQLTAEIKNFAPALQKIALEQRPPGGAWRTVHGLFTIEFQARAARPRTNLVHPFSAPVAWRGPAREPLHLRLAVRGFGQLAVRRIALTDGVTTLRARSAAGWQVLGRPAPKRGFPVFDWEKNRGVLALDFAAK